MCIQERKTAGIDDDDFHGVPVFQVICERTNTFNGCD